jgi:urease accessory protein
MTIMTAIMPTGRIITMTDAPLSSAALFRLMAWLSPSYPVGGFSYSHGLEWLVEEGSVRDVESLCDWLGAILCFGSGRNDAIFLATAHRAAEAGDDAALCNIAEHALAFTGSAERHMETSAQGQAFAEITRRTWGSATLDRLVGLRSGPVCYPVAVGIAAADHAVALRPALEAYVHGFTANLISAALRLVPLGHTDGQRALIKLEEAASTAVAAGMRGNLAELSSITVLADMAAMKHETQYTRLFRS